MKKHDCYEMDPNFQQILFSKNSPDSLTVTLSFEDLSKLANASGISVHDEYSAKEAIKAVYYKKKFREW